MWCPMHCDLFEIYCVPRIQVLGRQYADFILLRGLFLQAWGPLTSLKSQTRDLQLKVPPGGLVLRIFTSWKNPSTSAGFEPANLGISRRSRYPEATEAAIVLIFSLFNFQLFNFSFTFILFIIYFYFSSWSFYFFYLFPFFPLSVSSFFQLHFSG